MSAPYSSPIHAAAAEAMAALEPVFTGQKPSEINMPSGRALHAGADPSTVLIESHDNPDPEGRTKFIATYAAGIGSAVMKASIRAKDNAGRRNTDLHASRLLRRSLEYFDANNEQPVDTFQATWAAGPKALYKSDNHETYTRTLAADPESGRAAQGRAARETWTGRQMAELGFVWITSIKTSREGIVYATFKRPAVMNGPRRLINCLLTKRYES